MIFSTDDWRLRAPAVVLVSFYWLFGCTGELSHVDDNNLRSDVIDCEAAAAKLQNCCPSGVALPDCHYSKTVYTCGWPIENEYNEIVTDTPLVESTSETILSASCDEVVAQNYCTQTWPDNRVSQDTVDQEEQQWAADYEEDNPDGVCGEWGEL